MEHDILLLNDQPVTCPTCGSRTDFTTRPDRVQEHTCLANNQHVFLAQEDEENLLTSTERTRVYICLLDCDRCGAKRGQPCKSRNGKPWNGSHHFTRSPFHLKVKRNNPELWEKFLKLREQVMNQGEIPDHE